MAPDDAERANITVDKGTVRLLKAIAARVDLETGRSYTQLELIRPFARAMYELPARSLNAILAADSGAIGMALSALAAAGGGEQNPPGVQPSRPDSRQSDNRGGSRREQPRKSAA